MSRPIKPKKNPDNVLQMDAEPAGNVAVAEPEPETPFDAPKLEPTPASPATPKKLTFWQRVASIAKADWGTRAFIYVYCLEPICDLKRGGETKYLVKLMQPVEDENFLMLDYGSGKYRLTLVNRKPGIDKQDAIDNVEVEIYNPKYPPKIPRDVWMNDQRNNRWLALLPKEVPPAPPTPLGTVTDAFDTFTKIQDSIQSRIPPPATVAPPAAPVDRLQEFKSMLDIAKSAMPAPVAPATDNKVLDTVVQLMMKQLDASQQETKELRQELRDVMKSKQSNGETLETMFDKLEKIAPRVQGLLGLAGDKVTDIVQGRRRPWYEELALSALPQLAPGFNALMGAAANSFFAPKNGAPQLGAPTPAPTSQAALPAPADPLQALRQKVGLFMQSNIKPLQKHFEDFIKGVPRDDEDADMGKKDGTDFAYWVNESFGMDDLKAARELGSANIKAMFQQSPYWVAIAPYEGKFSEFLDQVLSFTPDEDEKEEDKPVDLTKE